MVIIMVNFEQEIKEYIEYEFEWIYLNHIEINNDDIFFEIESDYNDEEELYDEVYDIALEFKRNHTNGQYWLIDIDIDEGYGSCTITF